MSLSMVECLNAGHEGPLNRGLSFKRAKLGPCVWKENQTKEANMADDFHNQNSTLTRSVLLDMECFA